MLHREWVGLSSPRELCCKDEEELSLLTWSGEELQCVSGFRKVWSCCGGKDGLGDQALGIDADESTVLFLLGVGTICLAFCKSIYYTFSIPVSQVEITGNTLKKKRKRYLYMIVNNLTIVRSGVISSWMYNSLSENYLFLLSFSMFTPRRFQNSGFVDYFVELVTSQSLCGLHSF